MTNDCWNDPKTRRKMLSRCEDLNKKQHGKVLIDLIHGISHLKTIDLGCGNERYGYLFSDYEGIDLPEFNVYESDCKFIAKYDIVLTNAFIDVMEFPVLVMDKILTHATNYVIIHRQELTKEKTSVEKRSSYGGWTWHSKINDSEFYELLKKHNFEIIKKLSCGFDNWNDGGLSFLLKAKIC
jgi:hypothetical protein